MFYITLNESLGPSDIDIFHGTYTIKTYINDVSKVGEHVQVLASDENETYVINSFNLVASADGTGAEYEFEWRVQSKYISCHSMFATIVSTDQISDIHNIRVYDSTMGYAVFGSIAIGAAIITAMYIGMKTGFIES